MALNCVVEWAELATVDMTNAHTCAGRKALVQLVHDAIKDEGFLYVVNHGLTSDEVLFSYPFTK
jgi:isopenicillin N synthase-like dioxygenase